MTPTITHLPLTFRNPSPAVPVLVRPSDAVAVSRNEIGGGLRLTVEKFNTAFPMFAIQHPDRDALALMKKYASIYRRQDIAAAIEYYLNTPADEQI